MLSCADFLEEFGDYLDEIAEPGLKARLEEHLHECKTCQVIVDSTRKTIEIITDSDSFSLPPETVERLVQEIMARVRRR
jgi:predicted anti-sigma-YlaC factor YlaD